MAKWTWETREKRVLTACAESGAEKERAVVGGRRCQRRGESSSGLAGQDGSVAHRSSSRRTIADTRQPTCR